MDPVHVVKIASDTASIITSSPTAAEAAKTAHYIDLTVAAVIGVAGLIIGFFVHAIAFWVKAYSVFVTKSTCAGNKQACERLTDMADDTVKRKLEEHGRQLDEIFRFNREIYGMTLALVAKLKVAPVDREDFEGLRDLNGECNERSEGGTGEAGPKCSSEYACDFKKKRRRYYDKKD